MGSMGFVRPIVLGLPGSTGLFAVPGFTGLLQESILKSFVSIRFRVSSGSEHCAVT